MARSFSLVRMGREWEGRQTGPVAVPPPSPWRIDPGLGRDLAGLIGWPLGSGPVALLGAMADRVPAGTTAKLDALAAGEMPPGADPGPIARRVLSDSELGAPTPAWSCWALSTLLAALLEAGGHPASVIALRRIDDRAPAVDIHSIVLTDADVAGTVLLDPYFAAVLPGPGAAVGEGVHRGVRAIRIDEPDGRWSYRVDRRGGSGGPGYRALAADLDRGDVAAFCAISVTHTGVPPGPCSSLWRAEVATDAYVHRDGGAAVREWRTEEGHPAGDGHSVLTEHSGWAEAAGDMGRRVGFPLC